MDEIITKRCTKCGEAKELSEFYKPKKRKSENSICKECEAKKLKVWRSNNPEKVREQSRRACRAHREDRVRRAKEWSSKNKEKHNQSINRWHLAHPEKVRESNRKYRNSHLDKERERCRKYRKSHPDKVVLQVERRRVRKLNGNGNVTEEEWISVKEKYGKCLCCGRTDVNLTMDHILPLAMGGCHVIENIQPLCVSCNSKKHTKYIDFRLFQEDTNDTS